MTATPRTEPNWRVAEMTAEATPACAGGMPDTPMLVIGGLTRPRPAPVTAMAAATSAKDVPGPRRAAAPCPAAISSPLATSGTRAPWRPVTWPATGAATAITIMAGSSDSPARSGESPRTCCR